MTLSVKPQQIEDESLAGYLLRLSVRNGFTEASDWLNNRLARNAECSCIKQQDQTQIESSIGRSIIAHPILFTGNLSPLFISPIFTFPRFCPVCIHENAYFKQTWQNVGNLYCDKHQCLLEEHCQHCLKPFSWHKNILNNRCSSLDCQKPIHSNPIPPKLTYLSSQDIFDCYLTAHLVESPSITILHKTKHPNFHRLLNKIYTGSPLLESKKQVRQWFEELIRTSTNRCEHPTDFRFYSAELLLDNLYGDWPIKEELPQLLDNFRPAETKGYSTNIATVEITSKVLVKKFGISSVHFKEVMSLLEPEHQHKKIISPIHPINVNSIFQYLINNRQQIRNPITLKGACSGSESVLFDVYKAIFSDKLAFDYQPSSDLLNSILLSRDTKYIDAECTTP